MSLIFTTKDQLIEQGFSKDTIKSMKRCLH